MDSDGSIESDKDFQFAILIEVQNLSIQDRPIGFRRLGIGESQLELIIKDKRLLSELTEADEITFAVSCHGSSKPCHDRLSGNRQIKPMID